MELPGQMGPTLQRLQSSGDSLLKELIVEGTLRSKGTYT